VFLSVLFIVLMVMNRFNLIDLGQVDLGNGEYAVIDGDSLRKGQTEIRLVGIDAPEYRQSCSALPTTAARKPQPRCASWSTGDR
jgi:endonuclease YncB( thermonuclease family)